MRATVFLFVATTVGCKTFRQAPVEQSVADAREMSFRGIDAMERGDWQRAESLLNQAVTTNEEDRRAHRGYAETLWRRGAADQAIFHMERAVELSDGEPELLVKLGEMYLQTGRTLEAAGQADEAIRRNRHLASAWALQGDVLIRQGKRTDALASYQRALSCQAHYPPVQMSIAEIYRLEKRPRRMLATVQTLREQYPSGQVPQRVSIIEGLALKELGRFEEAVQQLAFARENGPSSVELLYELSECYFLAGDDVRSRHVLADLLQRDPAYDRAIQLSQHLSDLNREETASVRQRERR